MSDYTPTTAELRRDYSRPGVLGEFAAQDIAEAEAEFDRWLAAHDREVKARALREAAESPELHNEITAEMNRNLPFSWHASNGARNFLRAEADRIERGGE